MDKKKEDRLKMVKAMEFIVKNINDEDVMAPWFSIGVADGDIEYGELKLMPGDEESLGYYIEEENFKDLMDLFLRLMSKAKKSGGLYCGGVVSE